MTSQRFGDPTPFAPRPHLFRGVEELSGWRLKTYGIHLPDEAFDDAGFAGWREQILALLPTPAEAAGRPGVGFVILHQGGEMNYIVLGWWQSENELVVQVIVRERDGGGWRGGDTDNSFCVWDQEIMWAERNAYVATVLGGGGAGAVGDYLNRTLETPRHD